MNPFNYRDGSLFCEDVPLARIAAEFGTPAYVYSRSALEEAYRRYSAAFSAGAHLVCYAVKANSNIAILNLFARMGGGFDIVSGGELARVLAAGGDPGRVVFSGVGKQESEIEAALEVGILCFNVESAAELERLSSIAQRMNKTARVSLRVNPNVDANTHPYISTGLKQSKFGVAYESAFDLYLKAKNLPGLAITGIDCHIGSQLTDISPFVEALEKILLLVDKLAAAGISLSHIDIGGGLGIRYRDEVPPDIEGYARAIREKLAGRNLKILLEPGRFLVGNAGALLTRIEYLKHGEEKNFAIVDAAMNDLMRPALYDAYHEIVTSQLRADENEASYEIVGPVCESGDFLGHDRPLAVKAGDLLAVLSAGAYGMSMSSNYNSRPRAAEILVDGEHLHLIRQREETTQLFALEKILQN